MKNLGGIWKVELQQNKMPFFLLVGMAFLLGAGIRLAQTAESQISNLFRGDHWNADLVVLPKGITLEALKQEILTGTTTAFLPEALFKTTLELSQGQFTLQAILPIREHEEPRLLVQGMAPELGLQESFIKQESWRDQAFYRTPEWGNKVVAGFFASGSLSAMEKLKNLIDKKTVAQAFFVSEQVEKARDTQLRFQKALYVCSGLFLSLIFISLLSFFLWLKTRVFNTLEVLTEIGFSKKMTSSVLFGLFLLLILLPTFLGYECLKPWIEMHSF